MDKLSKMRWSRLGDGQKLIIINEVLHQMSIDGIAPNMTHYQKNRPSHAPGANTIKDLVGAQSWAQFISEHTNLKAPAASRRDGRRTERQDVLEEREVEKIKGNGAADRDPLSTLNLHCSDELEPYEYYDWQRMRKIKTHRRRGGHFRTDQVGASVEQITDTL